jgi:6-phosphogluconolactonase
MSVNWYSYPDADAAAKACAKRTLSYLELALGGGRDASWAVSGGTTPKLMFRHIVEMGKEARIDWGRVQLFFVDERAVGPTDPESNYRLCEEHFIGPAHFPHRNIHRIHGELPPDQAAQGYAADLAGYFGLSDGELPEFDVIHRGMGADAHTASLFPGEPLIEDRDGLVAAVYVEKLEKYRITMLPGILLNARHTVVLAAGADKADALWNVFCEAHEPLKYPPQIDTPHGRNVAWFLDDAASARLR